MMRVKINNFNFNNGPLGDRTTLDHLNTTLVRYSDPHCIPNIWSHCSKIPLNFAQTISRKIQNCYLQVVRQSSTQDAHQWLVILLPKMAHFCTGNLEPLGPVQYKKKMLEALGFKVIVIYLFEYKDAQRARKTRNLLLDKIHSIAKAKL